ncbi:MAG TPA: ribose 5-phosphate isomerase B [Dehalococcoidia bacterium]|nr:ribose 5-phosphate isomerase B [Dehalococcoidia bacterium]
MRVVVGADHRGYCLKDVIAAHLRSLGHEVLDVGTNDATSVDYPDIALAVGRAIRQGQAERGFVVCGSGVGAVVAANKLRGIRAAICHDTYSAHQGVEHDDMNVVCMGSRVVGEDLALEIAEAFVGARFMEEKRYKRRLAKVKKLEDGAESL